MRARLVFLAAVAAVLALSVACSDDDSDSEGGSTGTVTPGPGVVVDPCDLITLDDAQEALGAEAAPPVSGSSGPYVTCTWNTVDLSLNFVLLQLRSGVSADEFRESTQAAASVLAEDAAELQGLGDVAYQVGGHIYALTGETEIVLSNELGYDLADPAQSAEALSVNSRLMEDALGRVR